MSGCTATTNNVVCITDPFFTVNTAFILIMISSVFIPLLTLKFKSVWVIPFSILSIIFSYTHLYNNSVGSTINVFTIYYGRIVMALDGSNPTLTTASLNTYDLNTTIFTLFIMMVHAYVFIRLTRRIITAFRELTT